MIYPKLKVIPTSRDMVDVFKGYNHNLRIGSGEFYDMKNLSSDNYPVLSPRHQRGVYASPTNPQGMIAKDSLCYIDGGDFIINEYRVDMGLSVDDTPKTLISMGAYVIIMPDKKYINTANLGDYGNIEAEGTTSAFSFSQCDIDGNRLENVATEDKPTDPQNGDYWLDHTNLHEYTLRVYSSTTETWSAVTTPYIRIDAPYELIRAFSVGDGVNITCEEITQNIYLQDALSTSTVIVAKGVNHIVVKGIVGITLSTSDTLAGQSLTISRKMPNMDFIIESENRLWGCRYGVALNGEVVNEIYACKLGDFKNWNVFDGISTDSYVASVGTDGQFTGAITHFGYPIFFKETCMHKIYGNYPSNYQIQTTDCRGVQKGCEKSLAIVNETLYYKARSGVCSYDGSLPVEISSALGETRYDNAVAGSLGNKYYISMQDANEQYHLFVYDTLKGMWHREDDTKAMQFCNCRGDLYYIDHADNQIKTIQGTGTTETAAIKWMAETGILGTDSPDKKYISRLDVRMSLDVGTRVHFFVQYDSIGEWEHLFTMTGVKLQTFAVPIRPKRCDHMRLRIVGEGDAKIYSICKTIEQGSDM